MTSFERFTLDDSDNFLLDDGLLQEFDLEKEFSGGSSSSDDDIKIGSMVSFRLKDGTTVNGEVEKITDKKYKICCKPGTKSGEKGSLSTDKDSVKLITPEVEEEPPMVEEPDHQ